MLGDIAIRTQNELPVVTRLVQFRKRKKKLLLSQRVMKMPGHITFRIWELMVQ